MTDPAPLPKSPKLPPSPKRPVRPAPSGTIVDGSPGRKKPVLRPIRTGPSTKLIPRDTIAGTALVMVIAIMTFLACLTLGAISLVFDTASAWQNDISREVTIQIRPQDNVDMNEALEKAAQIALSFDGVSNAEALDEEATARLLEPWLGSGLDLNDLPVPRLVTVTMDEGGRPDFAAMRAKLAEEISGASLDDHRAWVDRLTTMARATIWVGAAIFILVLTATILTVMFATRGAMDSNRHVIDVLHFVGAEQSYIARQFENHFLWLGLKGSAIGGFIAILVFLIIGIWSGRNIATPENDQVSALFGTFSVGLSGYIGTVLVILAIALLTAFASRLTVFRHVGNLERASGVGVRSGQEN